MICNGEGCEMRGAMGTLRDRAGMPVVGALVCALGVGCAHGPNPEPSVAGLRSQGRTQVALDDNLRWPYQLDAVRAWVDGSEMTVRQPDGVLAELPLRRGDHTIALQLTATFPSAPFAERDCVIHLRTQRTFKVDDGARLEFDVHTAGYTERFDQAPTLTLRMEGAQEVLPSHVAQRDKPLRPVTADGMVREVTKLVEDARSERDVATMLCHSEKLQKMQVTGAMIEQRREMLATAEERFDHATIAHERNMLLTLDERLSQLWNEVLLCAATEPVVPARSDTVVHGPGCTGTEALEDLDVATR